MKIKILMREVDGQSIAFKVARYVLINDAMIAVKTSTSGNYDNNNYNIYIKWTSQRPADVEMEVVV
jgi:hypothetical protein